MSGSVVTARQAHAKEEDALHSPACGHAAKMVDLARRVCWGRLTSRLIYITRLAYWTARHRSLATARWVVEYEGHSW